VRRSGGGVRLHRPPSCPRGVRSASDHDARSWPSTVPGRAFLTGVGVTRSRRSVAVFCLRKTANMGCAAATASFSRTVVL
jgi:hypothetical protein